MKLLLFLSLLVLCTLQDTFLNRVVLPAKSQALCLDGTPGAYYVTEGQGSGKSKFIVFFEGGGWCGSSSLNSTIQSCYQRSLGDLGSSKNYPQTLNSTNGGILSSDATHNPKFYDWNKIYLKYCDGSGHQGTRSEPLNYKQKKLYFRGQNVTIGQLEAAETTLKLFSGSTDILVSGCSAGGLAAFTWTNYIASKAPKAKVYSVPDSGIFLDKPNVRTNVSNYRNQFINLMKISNAEVNTPVEQCHKEFPTDSWKCMFAEYLHKYIKVPLFPVESLYDSWSVPNILGISCIDSSSLAGCSEADRASLEKYHESTAAVITEITGRENNGVWSPACSNHCYMHTSAWTNNKVFAVPGGSDYSIHKSVSEWYERVDSGKGYAHMDTKPWPVNEACAGKHSGMVEEEQ